MNSAEGPFSRGYSTDEDMTGPLADILPPPYLPIEGRDLDEPWTTNDIWLAAKQIHKTLDIDEIRESLQNGSIITLNMSARAVDMNDYPGARNLEKPIYNLEVIVVDLVDQPLTPDTYCFMCVQMGEDDEIIYHWIWNYGPNYTHGSASTLNSLWREDYEEYRRFRNGEPKLGHRKKRDIDPILRDIMENIDKGEITPKTSDGLDEYW